jgi:DNA polymerase III epsilon subunit-like protein
MINQCNILVWDLETTGLDWRTSDVTQIACVAIEPRSLEIIPNSQFKSYMRPIDVMSGTSSEVESKWVQAQGALRVTGQKREELEKAPMPDVVWKAFASHVKRYNSGGASAWARPIAAGHNIQGFDLLFLQRYAEKYGMIGTDGKPNLFNPRTVIDTLNLCFFWFENMAEPESFSMNTLRPYFGISMEGAHSADSDVEVTANLLIKFMKLHRDYSKKVKFKGSFAK